MTFSTIRRTRRCAIALLFAVSVGMLTGVGPGGRPARADTVTLSPPYDCGGGRCQSVEGTNDAQVDLGTGRVSTVNPPAREAAVHVVFRPLPNAVSNLRLRAEIAVDSAENGGDIFLRSCMGDPCDDTQTYASTVNVGAGVLITYSLLTPVFPWVHLPDEYSGQTPSDGRNVRAGTVVQLWAGVQADLGQAITGRVLKMELLSDPAIPPQTTMSGGPAEYTASRTAAFQYGAAPTDEGNTFECKLDRAAFAPCPASGVTYDGLADGTHTASVRAVDYAGVTDPSPASYTWTVDTTPPLAPTITSGPSGTTNVPSLWSWTTEPGARSECWVDDADYPSCSSPFGVNPLPDGPHTFRVQATDRAGNVGPVASRSWVRDTTPPETALAGPGLTSSTTVEFDIASNDPTATFACSLDGADYAPCSSTPVFENVTEGDHTLAARATDPAGNTDPTPSTLSFTIDRTPPDTTVTSGPPAVSESDSATLAFTSNESGGSFRCSLDGAAYSPCTSPASYTGLSRGQHTFRVVAVDQVGHADATAATWTWSVGANRAPSAAGDSVSTNENAAKQVPVLANDSDPDGDALSVTGAGPAAHGTVVMNADGTVTYKPATNYFGPDSFGYTISDGRGGTNSATVSVTVVHINQPPTATNDTATTARSTKATIKVLANDSDPDRDALKVTSVGRFTKGGSATINTDQTVRYRPKTGFVGTETFVYMISDGHGHTASATVTVTVGR